MEWYDVQVLDAILVAALSNMDTLGPKQCGPVISRFPHQYNKMSLIHGLVPLKRSSTVFVVYDLNCHTPKIKATYQ